MNLSPFLDLRFFQKLDPGPDNITAYFLKKVRAHIASPLTRLFNLSLDEGYVPSDWKKAIIVPILKKKRPPKVLQIISL